MFGPQSLLVQSAVAVRLRIRFHTAVHRQYRLHLPVRHGVQVRKLQSLHLRRAVLVQSAMFVRKLLCVQSAVRVSEHVHMPGRLRLRRAMHMRGDMRVPALPYLIMHRQFLQELEFRKRAIDPAAIFIAVIREFCHVRRLGKTVSGAMPTRETILA